MLSLHESTSLKPFCVKIVEGYGPG